MMDSPQVASRRAAPRSAGRLDRDRQAAPQVFERLRDLIISLALPPGSPLSRAALAAQFGVSSTPIRDALMRLEEEGLVDVFPQYATVVSRVDVRLAQQAHFLRQALELEIVRLLAIRHDAALGVELNRIIARQQEFARAGDFESGHRSLGPKALYADERRREANGSLSRDVSRRMPRRCSSDEPTAHLDFRNQITILKKVKGFPGRAKGPGGANESARPEYGASFLRPCASFERRDDRRPGETA